MRSRPGGGVIAVLDEHHGPNGAASDDGTRADQAAGARDIDSTDAPIIIAAIAGDGSLYPIEKLEAHRTGVLHLAVSVFVFSGDALLIQQRAAGKYHCGGLWANTCCTHPHWDEPLNIAARRRMREELGVDTPLTPAGALDYAADVGGGLREWERVRAFTAQVDRDRLPLSLNPAEVAATRWATRQTLMAEAADTPEAFAPWFRIYLRRWSELALPVH